jgi:hypothetical protein
MIHARGDRYDGECKDGKFHGEGTYTWAVGNTYKGEWRNDKGHGQGVYIWADVRSLSLPSLLRFRARTLRRMLTSDRSFTGTTIRRRMAQRQVPRRGNLHMA